jgi:hypothetical protein
MYSQANVIALVVAGSVAVLLVIGLVLRLILKKPERHIDLSPRDNSVSDSLAARLAEHGHKAAKPEAPQAAKDA